MKFNYKKKPEGLNISKGPMVVRPLFDSEGTKNKEENRLINASSK